MTQTSMLKKGQPTKKRRLLKDKLSDLPINIDRFNHLIKGRRYQFLMRVMELFADLEGMFVNCQDLFKLYQQVFGDLELMQHFGHLTSLIEWLEEFSWVFRIEHLSQCYITLVERHKRVKPDQPQSNIDAFAKRVTHLLAANTAISITDLEHLYNKTYCTKLNAPNGAIVQVLKSIGQLQQSQHSNQPYLAFMIRDSSLVPSIRVKEVPPQFVCQEWTYGLCSLPPNECRLIHASMVSKKYLPPLCHFDLKGTCHYGESCFFRHSSNGFNAEDTAEDYLSVTPSSWLSKAISPVQATPTFTTTGISNSVQGSNMPNSYTQQPNSLPSFSKKTAPPPIQTQTLKVAGNQIGGTSPPESPWSPMPNSPFATSPYHSCIS
eukprot:NODE_14_length_42432_cov_0.433799.p10 type:complete len:377 gc:universal NODE_14_length_42432_cov_0.433799:32098-30968(-)